MKVLSILRFLLALVLVGPAMAETAVNPVSTSVEWFTKAAPPNSVAPNSYQAQVTLTFGVPNVAVTSWGTVVKEGSNLNVTISAVQQTTTNGGTIVAGPASVLSNVYDLGVLPLGAYNLRIFSGSALVKSVAFSSAQYPPSIPATAAVVVDTSNASSVMATVTLQFTRAVGMRAQPAVSRDSTGRYVLEAIADRLPGTTAQNALPPAFNLAYLLGAVPAGNKVAVFKLNGVTLVEKPFTIINSPDLNVGVTFTKSATTAGIALKARLEFAESVWALSVPGVPVRTENTFNISATAVAGNAKIFDPVYNLGVLPAGTYHVNYLINGQKKGEYDFTVEVTPPPPAPIALQSLIVHPEGTSQLADVALIIGSPATQITSWGTAVKDGMTFRANVVSTTSTDPVIQVVRTESHTYALGALEAGNYTFIQQVDGREIGRRTFAVAPPAVPRFVYLKPIQTDAGYRIEAAISLPFNTGVTDWGTMSRVENKFSATVTFGASVTANANATNAIVTHQYELGTLERGVYQAVLLKSDASVFGSVQFAVGGTVPPPPPQDGITLQNLTAFPDGGKIFSQLAVTSVDPNATVLDWGTPVVMGNTINYAIKIGPRPTVNVAGVAAAPVVAGPHLEMHTYPLGALAAGTYTGIVTANTNEIGRRQLVVGTITPPPPPPPPMPNVAYVKFGNSTAGRTAEVGILLPSPTMEVTDWGSVATTGNKLKVGITVGNSTPLPPEDPPVVQPVDPNDPGVVALAGAANASAEGASPVRLATHVYALGTLAAGSYTFTVCIGDREVVTRPFVVEGTVGGVYGQLLPSNIEVVKAGAHVIHLQFKSSNGMATAAGAQVKVTGPNGFSGTAAFKSESIVSADPLGMILNADFEVSTNDGSWDAADSGAYLVNVVPASVTDKAGKTLINGVLGNFMVRIWPTLPPTPLPVTVVVAQAEGTWQAKVTITSSSNTRPWKVKTTKPVLTNGSVLNLVAELEPGTAGTDPTQTVITYELGNLPPGNYRAVFKSNVGHCGAAAFVVAGVEPPSPISTWQQLAFANGDWSRPEIIADIADPDGDGVPNITEYCLGTDPIRSDASPFQPTIERDAAGQPHLVILFRRVTNATDVIATVEVSKDLKSWQPAGADVEMIVRSQDIDGTEQVSATQKAVLGQPGSWPYMRLHLEKVIVSQ